MTSRKPTSRPSALRHLAYFAGVVGFGFVIDLVVLAVVVGR